MSAGLMPVASGKNVVRALQKAGFEIRHVKGSHHVMLHRGPPARTVSVPVHGNRPLAVGTLASILKQAGISPAEFAAML